MIIIAGRLHVRAEERAAYLEAIAYVAPLARRSPGCLDFVQAADPVVPVPDVLDAEVRRYRIASVEDP